MMKLGKTTKVFPLPKMQIELFNQFVPQIKRAIDHLDAKEHVKIELKFVEHMAQVDGMRYNLSVSITKEIACLDLIEIAKCLDKYCVNQEDAFHASDDRLYTMGDGDDSGAVMFENGEFSIWVRGWPESQM